VRSAIQLYTKGEQILISDGFDWANPLQSPMPRPILLHGTAAPIKTVLQEGLIGKKLAMLNETEINEMRNYLNPIFSHLYDDPNDQHIYLSIEPKHTLRYANEGSRFAYLMASAIEQDVNAPLNIQAIAVKIQKYRNENSNILLIDLPSFQPSISVIEKLNELWNSNPPPRSHSHKVTLSEIWSEMQKLRQNEFSQAEAVQSIYRRFGSKLSDETIPEPNTVPPSQILGVLTSDDITALKNGQSVTASKPDCN
jgi:hypothetical protein